MDSPNIFFLFCGVYLHANRNELDLLTPDEAFQFMATFVRNDAILVQWKISDDYYMYRDSMKFSVVGDGLAAAIPSFPTGKMKKDVFGTVEVYKKKIEILLIFSSKISKKFQLTVEGQGCNESKSVCYPPIKHRIFFDGDHHGIADDELKSLNTDLKSPFKQPPNKVKKILGYANGLDYIDPPFQLSIIAYSRNYIIAEFKIKDGYYLYKENISFSDSRGLKPKTVIMKNGETIYDQHLGQTIIFSKDVFIPIILIDHSNGIDADQNDLFLTVNYQGCSTKSSLCFFPVKETFNLRFLNTVNFTDKRNQDVNPNLNQLKPEYSSMEMTSNIDNFSNYLILIIGSFFSGVLLTFTPCVLPMIPIIVSIIVRYGQNATKFTGGILSLIYVIGMAVTHVAMGAIAGSTGKQLQSFFQNSWSIGILSCIFFLMSLSMFGYFQIKIPSFIQPTIQKKSNNFIRSISLVFFLGLTSALIIGACVSPIFISVLSIAISKGDPMLGSITMLCLTLGMGVPVISLGFGAGYLIPRSGKWMHSIQHFFGIMLMALAIYQLQVLPQVPILLLWGTFVVIMSLLYFCSDISIDQIRWKILKITTRIAFLIWGIILLIGWSVGEKDVFNVFPMSLIPTVRHRPQTNSENLFAKIHTLEELEQQFLKSKQTHKKLLIEYYADWCIDCIKMKKNTFSDSQIQQILKDKFIPLQVDITNPYDMDTEDLKTRYNIFGPPAIIMINPDGTELKEFQFYGYKNKSEFLDYIHAILKLK